MGVLLLLPRLVLPAQAGRRRHRSPGREQIAQFLEGFDS